MMNRKAGWSLGGGVMLLFFVSIVSLSVGAADVPFPVVWKIIGSYVLPGGLAPEWGAAEEAIVWKVRLPRTVLAGLTGMALAMAGTAFQGVLRNPLSDPYVLGVSSGAALGAATVILFGWQGLLGGWFLPVLAFAGGMLSLLLVFRLSGTGGLRQTEMMILSGVIVQAFFGALLTFILSLAGDKLPRIMFWLMGSFAVTDLAPAYVLAPYVAAGGFVLWRFAAHLNVLALGERQAMHVGMSLPLVRWGVLGTASLLTAAAVSVSGTIGFVGLVIPHIVRRLSGPGHRWLLPLSALWGGVFMIACDTLARMLLEPRELPIGVITAFIGAPFFAYVLRSRRKFLQG